MGTKQPATTIYVDRETASLARAMAASTGRPVAQLFREFLLRLRGTLGGTDGLVTLAADVFPADGAPRNERPPLALTPRSVSVGDDPYAFDDWIKLDTTERVVLMGQTLMGAIAGHIPLWKGLLAAGKPLRVLIQGDLRLQGELPCYTPVASINELIAARRDAAIEALKELARNAPKDALEVRNSGMSLISYSAILVFRTDGMVDVQIQPYAFVPQGLPRTRARFMLSTRLGGVAYRLLVDPIEALWERSILELRSPL